MRKAHHRHFAWRIGTFLLLFALLTALAAPVFAQNSGTVVRVGWYESPFNTTDEQERRAGYAYEYQQKVAAYTGWSYQYVEGSWPELLSMLEEGRIDLLSDVSYTEERSERMLFSSLPMGSEDYILFASSGNEEISPEHYSTMNGKKVGVNKGSIQAELFRRWAESNGVQAEVVELTGSEDEHFTRLRRGSIDLYLTLDVFGSGQNVEPVCKIGSSDFYFAVSSSRSDLLPALNAAMDRIQEEDRYLNQKLYDRYLLNSSANRFLSPEEKSWLSEHGAIRVGYQDNYLSFCAKDPRTGELTGALKEYLSVASGSLENAHVDFETVAYPTSAAAMEAMKKGEVDCVFPSNLTDYDGEIKGYFITPALMRTDMAAVVRTSEKEYFSKKERITVAVNAGNPNYDMFLRDHFPDWRSIYFKDTKACLQAVAEGKADCLLISNYRFNNIAMLCEKYKLDTISTGVEMDYCLAVNRQDTELYSILVKLIGLVPDATVNSALSHYFTKDAKTSLFDMLRQNRVPVGFTMAAVLLLLVSLALRSFRAEKKVDAGQRLITATELDTKTGLYSRNYFFEYAARMYQQHPEQKMDAVALDIEQFRSVNAVNGRDYGNRVLWALGEDLRAFLMENKGIAGRIEGDRFAVYCSHLETPRELFNRMQGRLDSLSQNGGIQLRMGVKPWEDGLEPRRMVEQAGIACDAARERFQDQMIVFDETLRKKADREQKLMNDLHRALEYREFEVFYQGVYDLRAAPPKLLSAEALVRWHHPSLGLLEPEDFVPLFERSGQISAVDRFVWSEVTRQVNAWKQKLGVTVPVSVNLSRADLFDASLEGTVEKLAAENGLNPGELIMEVTESACSENSFQSISVIGRLRKKGFKVELDDFGADAVSLHLLSDLPVDALKLDRTMVFDLEHSTRARRRAELILSAAEHLKLPVIVKGVETLAQMELLNELGCTLMQGCTFASPLSAVDFETTVLRKC